MDLATQGTEIQAITISTELKPPADSNGSSKEVILCITFSNTSGERFDSIALHVVLPPQLTLISKSTRLFNRTNPDGMPLLDGITEDFAALGGYDPLDDQDRGQGKVLFCMRVNGDDLVNGVNTLNVTAQIAGYRDDTIVTDAFKSTTLVHVIQSKGLLSAEYHINFSS